MSVKERERTQRRAARAHAPVWVCQRCLVTLSTWPAGSVCVFCGGYGVAVGDRQAGAETGARCGPTPKPRKNELIDPAVMSSGRIAQAKERTAVRAAVLQQVDDVWLVEEWYADHPGTPLGNSGTPLRLDGESHSNWWRRVLRDDVCAYCGLAGGTVDHVEPQMLGGRDCQRWTNLTGCCSGCNGSKRDRHMLIWLLTARPSVARMAEQP